MLHTLPSQTVHHILIHGVARLLPDHTHTLKQEKLPFGNTDENKRSHTRTHLPSQTSAKEISQTGMNDKERSSCPPS